MLLVLEKQPLDDLVLFTQLGPCYLSDFFETCEYCLTYYHTIPHIDALKIYSCGNIVRKGETACNKQFHLFSQCFLPYNYFPF